MHNNSLNLKLNEITKQVDPIIESLLSANVDKKLLGAVLQPIKTGGKRLRPALLILSGRMFGADTRSLLYPAASIEILHNATLMVDDIIDHSEIRRGEPTNWKKYGKSITECVILDYLSAVFEGLRGIPELISLYGQALKFVVNGEVKDILFETSGRGDEEFVVKNRYKIISKRDYLEMISQKTAALFRTSCEAGAICAGADKTEIKNIGDFGFNLGMAFQIRDDILDIFGDEKELGKQIGKDIIEGKNGNLVILNAIEHLGAGSRKMTKILSGSSKVSKQDVGTIVAIIKNTSAREITEGISKKYVQAARASLELLPRNDCSLILHDLLNFIAIRES